MHSAKSTDRCSAWRDRPAQLLSLQLFPLATPAAFGGARALRFEYSSNGDRVPGRLMLPATGDGPFPVVLLEHAAGGAKEAPYLDSAAAPWVREGVAVASIDLPLHGARRSAKLSQRLLDGLSVAVRGEAISSSTATLLSTFAAQAVHDLEGCVDALAELHEIDERRLVYAGFSLGAIVGAIFCAHDPRPRAAALALAGGGLVHGALDPRSQIAQLAPRPLLMLNASHDALVSRAAAEALFAAAGEPKQIEWFECDHENLPGAALKSMWRFIARQLGDGQSVA